LFNAGQGFAITITSPSDLPAGSDPSRVLTPPPQTAPDFENIKPPKSKTQSIATPPIGAEKIQFVLKDISFSGMTAYTPSEIRSLYEDQIGKTISLADLFVLSSKLQQQYFDDGYSFVRVSLPQQNIKNGIAQINVIEGGVSEVRTENLNTDSPLIADTIAQIQSMKPLNVLQLERLLLVMNDFVDGDVVSVVSSSSDANKNWGEGFIRIALVKQTVDTWSGYVQFNNHGSIFSGPYQAQTNIARVIAPLNYTKASLSMAGAIPLNDMKNLGMNFKTPIWGASGATASLGYTRGWTEAGATLDTFDIIGNTELLNVGFSYPILRQRDVEWDITTGLGINNINSDFLSNTLYRDRIRILTLGTNYTGSDNESGVNFASFIAFKGLNVFGARETGAVELSRDEAKSDFLKFEGSLGRLQSLPMGFEAYGSTSFQWSNDPLFSSEEFGFGGADRGRGYTASEITGDKGVSASVELRKNIPAPQLNLAFQPYGFYDVGVVKNNDSTESGHESAASAGLGVRVYAPNGVNADFTMAKPLTRNVENPQKYTSEEGLQFLFSVQKSF
jgi:hemolysin activation/secretion protein